MGTVVSDIITPALRRIGVLAEGEVPTAAQASDALADLNALIDQHAAERLQIFTTTRTVFSLVADKQSYLLGSDFDQPDEDGFDTQWAGAPDGWTPQNSGDGTIANDTADFQAGGHSIRMDTAVSGTSSLYKDYLVQPGEELTLTVWTFAGFTVTGFVRVQNTDTGNYLDSSGDWVGAADPFLDAIESPAGAAFVQKSLTFDVETENLEGATTTTLRITFRKNDNLFSAWFDTFSLTGRSSVSIPRPIFIDRVTVRDSSIDPPLEIPLTKLPEDQWEQITNKELASTFPNSWYYNPTFPYGTLTFWPIPTGSTYEAVLYIPTQTSTFVEITDTFSMPPGYLRMLVTNLALELAPSYEKVPSPLLMRQASDSLAVVKRANQRPTELAFDSGALIGGAPPYSIPDFWSGR